MPFVIVNGIPNGVSADVLLALRRKIVSEMVISLSKLDIPANWIRVFFPIDRLGDPLDMSDGCNTIYARIDTALFSGSLESDDELLALKVSLSVTSVIWHMFGGKYEVETFIGNLDGRWKTLLKAAS